MLETNTPVKKFKIYQWGGNQQHQWIIRQTAVLNGGGHELLRSKSKQRPEEDEDLKEVNNSKWDPGEENFR